MSRLARGVVAVALLAGACGGSEETAFCSTARALADRGADVLGGVVDEQDPEEALRTFAAQTAGDYRLMAVEASDDALRADLEALATGMDRLASGDTEASPTAEEAAAARVRVTQAVRERCDVSLENVGPPLPGGS